MEFNYVRREWSKGTVWIPTLPVSLNHFPIGNALIDTGADVTLLPMELYQILDVELDKGSSIEFTSAGGSNFKAIPCTKKIEYSIEHSGFRPIRWKGVAYFVEDQPTVLLGQYQCLSELKLMLDGKKRKISVELR
jgi:hypothetical protein